MQHYVVRMIYARVGFMELSQLCSTGLSACKMVHVLFTGLQVQYRVYS